jgi:hypothetical protein
VSVEAKKKMDCTTVLARLPRAKSGTSLMGEGMMMMLAGGCWLPKRDIKVYEWSGVRVGIRAGDKYFVCL